MSVLGVCTRGQAPFEARGNLIPGVGVTGRCELSSVGAGNWTLQPLPLSSKGTIQMGSTQMFPRCRESSTCGRKGTNQFLLTDITARLVFSFCYKLLCWPSCHTGLHMCDQLHLQEEFLKWIQDNQCHTRLNLCVDPLDRAHLIHGCSALF